MKTKKTYRFSNQTENYIEQLIKMEEEARERSGIKGKVAATEIIETAIAEYYALRVDQETGNITESITAEKITNGLRETFQTFILAINGIKYDTEVLRGMLRIILNQASGAGALTDEQRIKIINQACEFENLIEFKLAAEIDENSYEGITEDLFDEE